MDRHQPDDGRLRRLARASSLALDATEYADVPPDVVAELRSICLGLPETTENQAWAGTQWRIRTRTFAHLLTVDFADGPVTVMTFRSSGPELDALRSTGHPFFRPAWGADAVGIVLDAADRRRHRRARPLTYGPPPSQDVGHPAATLPP